jgi:hypothetical protein
MSFNGFYEKKARDSVVEAHKGAQPEKRVIDDDAIIFG